MLSRFLRPVKPDPRALLRPTLRIVRKRLGVPAVALTAYARPEDRRQIMLAGYQVHVSKPVDATELLAVVASLAGRI